MLPEPIAVTLEVTAVLEQLAIPYILGGSFASAIHGVVRTTQDSDILAEIEEKHIEAFILAHQEEFYLDDQMIYREVRQSGSFNIIVASGSCGSSAGVSASNAVCCGSASSSSSVASVSARKEACSRSK